MIYNLRNLLVTREEVSDSMTDDSTTYLIEKYELKQTLRNFGEYLMDMLEHVARTGEYPDTGMKGAHSYIFIDKVMIELADTKHIAEVIQLIGDWLVIPIPPDFKWMIDGSAIRRETLSKTLQAELATQESEPDLRDDNMFLEVDTNEPDEEESEELGFNDPDEEDTELDLDDNINNN